ncbi:MAG: ribosomal subunit interface protein [Anaerolinea sp.]|nr:ribosomal subunit interface protein [Anaerolinea sp.]
MALKIEVLAKNMEVTERINDYVSKKVSRLDRYLSDIEEVKIELAKIKSARSALDRHVAQITVRGQRGELLRTEERSEDIFAAFDTALDKIQRQIARLKGKRQRGRGDGRTAAEVVEPPLKKPAKRPASPIMRRKTFTLPPMNEAEALEQMKMLSHDNFFIFNNAETKSINVLYRRRDGTYGLIEPMID